GTPGLAVVAVLTGGDEVLPRVPAAAVAREYVVQRQLTRLPAAVLARVAVAYEHLAPGQAHLWTGPLHEVHEADDRRKQEDVARAPEPTVAVLENLRFPPVEERERAACVADVDRLVVLVKD